MITLKPQPAQAGVLAAWAWAAVALTPAGWFCGVLAIAYSHLGDVTDAGMMTEGVALFVTPATSAFILAVYAARAGHRSGKIARIVSGLLLLATTVVMVLYGGWVGLAVAGVIAALVLAWARSRRIAVVISGLLLLATLAWSAWQSGGWINVAGIAGIAVVAVLVFAWARPRHQPPPGPDGIQHEGPHTGSQVQESAVQDRGRRNAYRGRWRAAQKDAECASRPPARSHGSTRWRYTANT